MDWKKFALTGSVALAALALAVAPAAAQSRGHGGGGHSGSAGSAHFAGHSGSFRNGGGNWHGNGHWNGGHHWRGGHNNFYFGGFGYPYGYGFSPYAWGYGYPYYGSSAAIYYNGYDNGYDRRVYNGRAVNEGGGSVVANVQQELARAGYYHGTIDGVIGEGTRHALRAYQRRNGLQADGRIGSEVLDSMGLN